MRILGSPFAALIAILVILSASPSLAKSVGTVMEVAQGAQVQNASGTTKVTVGMQVETGDVIKTNGFGQVQIFFGDDTKIAVGSNSQLVLDDILLRSNGSAKRFAVNALGGTFRFISGKSSKKVYDINTPTATMGIRGTAFDFFVERSGATSLVLFEGEVDLCLRNGNCERVTGACTLSRARTADLRIGIEGRELKKRILRDDFPYIVSQRRLLSPLHVPTRACGSLEEPEEKKRVTPPPPPPPPPPPEPEPEPEPKPEPEPEPEPERKPEIGPKPELEQGPELDRQADR